MVFLLIYPKFECIPDSPVSPYLGIGLTGFIRDFCSLLIHNYNQKETELWT
jgi:hypothetical protein